MPKVAYISNQFPSSVEPYVVEEIQELRGRGTEVVACSARRTGADIDSSLKVFADETLFLQPLRAGLLMRAAWLCVTRFPLIDDLIKRVLVRGNEPPGQRMRTLLHTWLGAYYALLIEDSGVEHIHAHHGYFASWIAMVAARLLNAGFSMTLHGSDLLVRAAYLDTKLQDCKFCLTVSEFNRQHILKTYPQIAPGKIIVQRMGVAPAFEIVRPRERWTGHLVMLAVGRLHPVKNHAFLLGACRKLKDRGIPFLCLIAGEGTERGALKQLIHELKLQEDVKLLGHLNRSQLDAHYAACDLVVLTSRSEGIPLVLMEAMAHERLVLAPAITGIPELVEDGKTGFLYCAGSTEDFVARVEAIHNLQPALGPLRMAARRHVLDHFNRERNLAAFGDFFLSHVLAADESSAHENSVLQ